MTDARSVWERELRIEDDSRKQLRRQIDPLIQSALEVRGFTEERTVTERLPLDGSTVLASDAYRATLTTPFDALSMRARYDVSDGERMFNQGRIDLFQIGGFATARLVAIGSRFFYSTTSQKGSIEKTPLTRVKEDDFRDIIEDVRAHTVLGNSQTDQLPSVAGQFTDLEGITSSRFIDRRTHLQLLADPSLGDVQVNVGESFEERDLPIGGHLQKRRRSQAKMFELIARQPIDDGYVSMGIHYRSGPRGTEMKLSSAIDGTQYSEAEQEGLYQEAIRSFQDPRYSRFGDAVIRNLKMVANQDSEIVRVG